jgi:RHS repeat-associated protein
MSVSIFVKRAINSQLIALLKAFNFRIMLTKMNINIKLFILLMLLVLISFQSFAQNDPEVTTVLKGVTANGIIQPLIQNATCNVQDPIYYQPAERLRIEDDTKDTYKNTITLSIDEEGTRYIPHDFIYSIKVNITFFGVNNENTPQQVNNVILTVSYTKAAGLKYDARQYYFLNNARKVEVTVFEALPPMNGGWDPRTVLRLENRLIATRDYKFSCQEPVSSISTTKAADELTVNWLFADDKGATHFDVEWTWIDQEILNDPTNNDFKVNGILNADKIFNRNSTRVTISKSDKKYAIPFLYDRTGVLFYRIRPVQYKINGDIVEGMWNVTNTPTVNDQFAITASGHEADQFNWQASTSYAEEGKRKTVIQYFDGTLKSRQTVTKDNSQSGNTTVVAETFYDLQGRPVINILPAPTLNTVLSYARNFNRFIGQTSTNHPKDYYDALGSNQNICNSTPLALDNNFGSAKYYSTANNMPKTGENTFNNFIPDSEGFPYTETRYSNDATGRIAEQSGVGATHKLNSGHQTKYFYGGAAEEELVPLFGVEVGQNSHYFKNMVVDANGQVSVSYIDMKGKTIATALAGKEPSNLDALTSKNAAVKTITKSLLTKENNIIQDRSVVSSSTLLVDKVGPHTFRYNVEPNSAEIIACNPQGQTVCYDCYYRFQLKVTDACGNIYLDEARNNLSFINNIPVYDTNCNTANYPTLRININFDPIILPVGEYNITKTLTIDKSAQDWYRENIFKPKNICETVESIKTTVLAQLQYSSDCSNLTCESCTTQIGTTNQFRENFLNLLYTGGVATRPNPIPESIESQIETAYNESLSTCAALCEDKETELNTIEENMLLDMTPGAGQYARQNIDINGDGDYSFTPVKNSDEDFYENVRTAGSERRLNVFNIEGYNQASHIPQNIAPYYKNPKDFLGVSTQYKNENGIKDPVAYDALGNILPEQQFVQDFKDEWAQQLLFYHPEYPKLKYAKEKLLPIYLFKQQLDKVDTWAKAYAKNYVMAPNSLANADPFYTSTTAIPAPGATFKIQLETHTFNFNTRQLSLWQTAYFAVHCNTKNSSEILSCLNTIPTNDIAILTAIESSMCQADKNSVWNIYKSLYETIKNNHLSTLLDQQMNPGILSFIKNSVGIDKCNLRFPSFIDFSDPNTFINKLKDKNDQEIDAEEKALYKENCEGYISMWVSDLKNCDAFKIAYENLSETEQKNLMDRFVNVCTFGSDANHPLGSSSVNPITPISQNSDRNFRAIITSFFNAKGINLSNTCHPVLITSPRPYGVQPPVSDDIVILTKDECLCNNLEQIKTKMITKGYSSAPNGVANNMRLFLLREFKVDMRTTLLDSLINGCNANPITCNTYDPPLLVPGFLTDCKPVADNCINCAQYEVIKNQFKVEYPLYNAVLHRQQGNTELAEWQIEQNEIFATYMNQVNGFNKTWYEYAMFEDSSNPVQTANSCDTLKNTLNGFNSWYHSRPAPVRDVNGCDISTFWFINGPQSLPSLFSQPGFLTWPTPITTPASNNIITSQLFRSTSGACINSNNAQDSFVVTVKFIPKINYVLGITGCFKFEFTTVGPNNLNLLRAFSFGMNDYDSYIAMDGIHRGPELNYRGLENSTIELKLAFSSSTGFYTVYKNNTPVYNAQSNTLINVSQIYNVGGTSVSFYQTGSETPSFQTKLDFFKFQNVTANEIFYEEDFNNCSDLSWVKPKYDCNKGECTNAFRNYFIANHTPAPSSTITYAQIQNLYAACNIQIDLCNNVPPPPTGPTLCGRLEPITITQQQNPYDPCDYLNDMALQIATLQYQNYVTKQNDLFHNTYLTKCLEARNYESLTVTSEVAEYHYTLYYYDQAGNLVKTVPPSGAVPDFSTTFLNQVSTDKAVNAPINNDGNSPTRNVPKHTLATHYRYNSLNQVVAQITPDGGLSKFWYDALGRLAVSQNAKQKAEGKYSYTLYDNIGRIREVGQKSNTQQMTQAISQDVEQLTAWVLGSNNREQVTRTTYDIPAENFSDLTNVPAFEQTNLRNRVSFIQYFDGNPTGTIESQSFSHSSATYYTYDIHGNVNHLVQDYKSLLQNQGTFNRFKQITYDYDLISGKVNQVAYQPNFKDAFYYKYQYDAENKITKVFTSKDKLYWEEDARYAYYRHGPMARTELGQLRVQGLDYAYTIQGWLKGVNGTAIQQSGTGTSYDMGQDGLGFVTPPTPPASPTGSLVARDAFSFSLNYFNNDYKPITNTTNFANIIGGGPLPATADGKQTGHGLFNGNIAAMAVNIPVLSNGAMVYGYKYDQLNRIVAMNAHYGLNNSTNTFTAAVTENYKERITYDANGNILTYLRNAANGITAGSRLAMDNLAYTYKAGTNQLDNVADNIADAAASEYDKYNDIKQGQANNNYQYDAIGNLISDQSEYITEIKWTVYGKIESIEKAANNGKPATSIKYAYDAAGNRISKAIYENGNTTAKTQTYYVRDASGNVMAIYEQGASIPLTQTEVLLYGSSRLGINNTKIEVTGSMLQVSQGIATFTRGNKFFELSNHLGNVLVTITDKKLVVTPQGAHCTNGGAYNILNVTVRGTEATYVAKQEINFLPSLFASTTNDAFTAYIDTNLPLCVPPDNMPSGSYFAADVVNANDYYPFGMIMPGRSFSTASGYRYGFNGKEKSDEIASSDLDFGARIMDARLGRWLSVDPLANKYPSENPFCFVRNSPLLFKDVDGNEGIVTITIIAADGKKSYLRAINKDYLLTRRLDGFGKETTNFFTGRDVQYSVYKEIIIDFSTKNELSGLMYTIIENTKKRENNANLTLWDKIGNFWSESNVSGTNYEVGELREFGWKMSGGGDGVSPAAQLEWDSGLPKAKHSEYLGQLSDLLDAAGGWGDISGVKPGLSDYVRDFLEAPKLANILAAVENAINSAKAANSAIEFFPSKEKKLDQIGILETPSLGGNSNKPFTGFAKGTILNTPSGNIKVLTDSTSECCPAGKPTDTLPSAKKQSDN